MGHVRSGTYTASNFCEASINAQREVQLREDSDRFRSRVKIVTIPPSSEGLSRLINSVDRGGSCRVPNDDFGNLCRTGA